MAGFERMSVQARFMPDTDHAVPELWIFRVLP
jgi:hypothetical protein